MTAVTLIRCCVFFTVVAVSYEQLVLLISVCDWHSQSEDITVWSRVVIVFRRPGPPWRWRRKASKALGGEGGTAAATAGPHVQYVLLIHCIPGS